MTDEPVLFGTIHGWSEKLGIPVDVLRERLKDCEHQLCRATDPDDPELEMVTEAYAEDDVLRVCADLLKTMTDEDRRKYVDQFTEILCRRRGENPAQNPMLQKYLDQAIRRWQEFKDGKAPPDTSASDSSPS